MPFQAVYLTSDSFFGLDFLGVDTIDSLFVDGDSQPLGTYGAVGSGADFENNHFTGAGLLQVSTFVGFRGDFDVDDDVDGFDFLKWQRGESPDALSAEDLTDWEANYGAVASPIIATSSTVPEPRTVVMLMLGMAATLLRRCEVVS